MRLRSLEVSDSRRWRGAPLFDAWSRVYDNPAVQAALYRPVHEAVLAELRQRPASRVLDIGCGTGILARRIDAELGTEAVVGFDFSAGMLERAARPTSAVWWVQGDAQLLPARDRSVDAIVSTEAFHWFPDHDAALAEFFRALEPGGRLLLAMVIARTVAGARALSAAVGGQGHWPTRLELVRELESAGFRIVRQQRVVRLAGLLLRPLLTIAIRPA